VDVQLALGYQDLRDVIGATSTVNRRWSRDAELLVSGDVQDGLLGGGVTAGSISYSSGYLRLRDPTAEWIDHLSARTAGRYDKAGFTALRLQRFNPAVELYLGLSGQLAGGNLDPSEKFTLGGPNGVRSYAQGEGAGDNGILGTTELRYTLPDFGTLGRAQTLLFFDAGRIEINQDAFLPGPNRRSLYGAGVGINLLSRNGFGVRSSWAWKLGDEPALADEDSGSRGWVQFAKQF
jgi:hemolysin activation/secretion protein